jgi:hypothetical protein
MTTDRTQPARPAALNDRSSAAPAERRDGGAFAALLDAHAPAPRRDEGPRGPEPRNDRPRHDHPRDAATGTDGRDQARSAEAGAEPREQTAAPGAPACEPAPQAAVLPSAPTGQPVVIPPFVATLPAEMPAAPAAPVLPAATAPLFMLAPEAVAAAAPLPTATLATAPELPVAAVLPSGTPVAGTPAAPAQPTATPPTEAAPVGPQPHEVAPDAVQAPVVEAPAPEAEQLPAEPVAAPAESPAAPEAHAAAPTRAAATAEPAPAAAPATAQASNAEPVVPAAVSTPPSGGVTAERTVPLHRTPAAVSTLLHVAVERGISHAKMALRPVELGGIEIRLQTTAGGIAAQVVADSPEAARLLAQAGDDLRRALEARDVTLVSLEVSTTADQQQRESARGEWSDSRDSDPTSPRRAAGDDTDGDTEQAPSTQTVIELPGGLLVDVLA